MSSLRILIVDDNPDDRALVVREALSEFPQAEIREISSRPELEQAFARKAHDLVVTDYDLKWGDGREVLTLARISKPDCAVIMFTDSGDEMTAVELMKAGLDDYVVKSVRQLARLRTSMRIAVDQAKNKSALNDRERQLQTALAHQRVIVRELHHRVRNNLQTITSLLELRARAKGGNVAVELEELASRMRALAEVQSRIYDSDALDRVDFSRALVEIANEMERIYRAGSVEISSEIAVPLDLGVHRAMPLALLCHELLLNSFKHAWPEGRRGELTLRVLARESGPMIEIADDGIGFDPATAKTGLGSRLSKALALEANAVLAVNSAPSRGTIATVTL
jgi:two-component sensor histidine kinase